MFTLRCTQKLLKRMHLTVDDLKNDVPQPPTTALGDWYAHLLILQRQHIVILVSEHSRLCVLTSARDMDRLTQRFHYAVIDLFRSLGIPEEAIERERRAMSEIC